ncbi:MAG: hypothetical protein LBG89_03245 [Rickettsiales bacterium]|jgi:putative N-acetylmannosamine-6-phosphate epimerase|nr:hypothetical protein [Rickettsiales bacterium]
MKKPTIEMLHRYYAEQAAQIACFNQRFSVEKATERQIVRSAKAQGIRCESAEDIAKLRAQSVDVYNAMLADAKDLAAANRFTMPALNVIKPIKSAAEFNCVIFDHLCRTIQELRNEIVAAPLWHSLFAAAMADTAQGGDFHTRQHLNLCGAKVKQWMNEGR